VTTAMITAQGFGCAVGLRLAADDLDAIRPMLPYWWRDVDLAPAKVWDVPSVAGAELVISDLELWVADHAVDLVFVHAGVVARDGRALLLPGRSFTGKSGLTAALLAAGADYGSDEYAVLDANGLVRAYPRPMSLRDEHTRRRVPASDYGARTFSDALPVAAIAALAYQRGGEWDAHEISAATAVLRLLDNTVCAQSRPDEALHAVVAAARNAQAIEGFRGEASDAATQLLALL